MNKRKSDIDGSRLQEDGSDTATDPITPECEGDASEHQIDFVMKMPDCVVDPESREQLIRYFQQQAGSTYCCTFKVSGESLFRQTIAAISLTKQFLTACVTGSFS